LTRISAPDRRRCVSSSVGVGALATGHGRPAWLAPDKARRLLSAAISKASSEDKGGIQVSVSQE
jgi:hypothetical protein